MAELGRSQRRCEMMNPHPGPSTKRLKRRNAYRAPERAAEAAARVWSEADLRQAAYLAAVLAVALVAATLPLAALLR